MLDSELYQEVLGRFSLLLTAVPIGFTALMPVVNPIGTAVILSGLTSSADASLRSQLARRIAINSAMVLVVSLLVGSKLLEFFGVSVAIVQALGGFVLASMGWKMLNKQDSADEHDKVAAKVSSNSPLWESVFYPFTFPITVGPGCVAVAITLSAHSQHADAIDTVLTQLGYFVGIVCVSILVYLCYKYSSGLMRHLGRAGTAVLMRLISFLVACIGAQISWQGIAKLIAQIPS